MLIKIIEDFSFGKSDFFYIFFKDLFVFRTETVEFSEEKSPFFVVIYFRDFWFDSLPEKFFKFFFLFFDFFQIVGFFFIIQLSFEIQFFYYYFLMSLKMIKNLSCLNIFYLIVIKSAENSFFEVQYFCIYLSHVVLFYLQTLENQIFSFFNSYLTQYVNNCRHEIIVVSYVFFHHLSEMSAK